jgi:hypothetical protein
MKRWRFLVVTAACCAAPALAQAGDGGGRDAWYRGSSRRLRRGIGVPSLAATGGTRCSRTCAGATATRRCTRLIPSTARGVERRRGNVIALPSRGCGESYPRATKAWDSLVPAASSPRPSNRR